MSNNLQHLRSRRLLLQRFREIVGALAQLAEQPRVLDGDDGLGREICQQLDLFGAERTYLLPIDGDGADQFTLLEQRDEEVRSGARGLHEGNEARVALQIAWLGRQIGNIDDASGSGEAVKRVRRIFADQKNRFLAHRSASARQAAVRLAARRNEFSL